MHGIHFRKRILAVGKFQVLNLQTPRLMERRASLLKFRLVWICITSAALIKMCMLQRKICNKLILLAMSLSVFWYRVELTWVIYLPFNCSLNSTFVSFSVSYCSMTVQPSFGGMKWSELMNWKLRTTEITNWHDVFLTDSHLLIRKA